MPQLCWTERLTSISHCKVFGQVVNHVIPPCIASSCTRGNERSCCFQLYTRQQSPTVLGAQGAVAAIFRNHVHCQFYFRGADRSDITMEVIRNRVRQIIGKGACGVRDRLETPPGIVLRDKVVSRSFFERSFFLLFLVGL